MTHDEVKQFVDAAFLCGVFAGAFPWMMLGYYLHKLAVSSKWKQ